MALQDAKLMAEKEYIGLEAGLGAAADEEVIEGQADQAVEQARSMTWHHPRLGCSPQISCRSEFLYPTGGWAAISNDVGY